MRMSNTSGLCRKITVSSFSSNVRTNRTVEIEWSNHILSGFLRLTFLYICRHLINSLVYILLELCYWSILILSRWLFSQGMWKGEVSGGVITRQLFCNGYFYKLCDPANWRCRLAWMLNGLPRLFTVDHIFFFLRLWFEPSQSVIA